jgi:hypothetical protein
MFSFISGGRENVIKNHLDGQYRKSRPRKHTTIYAP